MFPMERSAITYKRFGALRGTEPDWGAEQSRGGGVRGRDLGRVFGGRSRSRGGRV